MKKDVVNDRGHAQAPYISPNAKIVEISVQKMLCGSNEKYYSNEYNPWEEDDDVL